MRLQQKLFLLAGFLVTVSLLTVAAVTRLIIFRHLEGQARQEAQTLATELARSTDRFLEGARAQLETLARLPPVSNFDQHEPEEVEAHLAQAIAASPAFEKFYLATAQGLVTIKVRRDGRPPVKGEMIDYRAYFQEAMKGKTAISDVLISNTSGLPILVLATPIEGPSGPKGVLCGLLDPLRLFAHIYELASDRPVVPLVIDRNGIVIAHPDRARLFVENLQDSLSAENLAALKPFEKKTTGHGVMTYQGERILFAFQEHRPTGWTHIVTRPYKDFMASLAETRNAALAVLAVGVLLTALLTRRTVGRITAPVRALVASTQRVTEGHLDEEVHVETRDEIGELSEAFNQMVAGLRERESLRAEKERMRLELESARVIQQSFLPTTLPGADDPRVGLAALSRPAATVGGDYYDVVALGRDRLGLVIADVSGKGIPGALYMARLVSDFRFLTDPHQENPAHTITALNRLLMGRGQAGMFVTLLYAILDLDRGTLALANAGHLPVLLRRSQGGLHRLDGRGGPPLGILPEVVYEPSEVRLRPGDEILLFTDGLTEARNPSREPFRMERLAEVLRHAPPGAQGLIEAVSRAVEEFTALAPAHDDITLLAARWEGSQKA
jgi:serine phosphatase RsbU (regulator of sigma subunit)